MLDHAQIELDRTEMSVEEFAKKYKWESKPIVKLFDSVGSLEEYNKLMLPNFEVSDD